jgi:hypothetical protein
MEQNVRRNAKRSVANFFGAFGYFFGFLQWFWVVMLYFSVIQSVTLFVMPKASDHIEQPHVLAFTLPNSVEVVILVITVAIMLSVMLYVLIKIPMSIVKTGNKVVHKTAETMTPMVLRTQHKQETKKFRDMITSKLILAIKLLLILIPIALTVSSGLLQKQSIDYAIALIIGCGLACFSVIFFAIQYTAAGLLRVKLRDLW